MRVGVYSCNNNLCESMLGMAVNCGCKICRICEYDKSKLKGNDILIIDLDKCPDSDNLDKTIKELQETIIIGISRDENLLEKYKNDIFVEKKPLNQKTLRSYVEKVKSKYSNNQIVNKDKDRVYTELGTKIADDFDSLDVPFQEKIDLLKRKIHDSYKGPNEKTFLNNTGLDKIKFPDGINVNISEKVKKDDALTKYRIKKLKSLNLTTKEIDDKIEELNLANQRKTVDNTVKFKVINEQQDILRKLKSGYFRNISKPNAPTKTESVPVEEKIKTIEKEPKPEIPIKKDKAVAPVKNIVPEIKPILEDDVLSLYKEKEKEQKKKNIKEEPVKKDNENKFSFSKPILKIDNESDVKNIDLPKGIPLKPVLKLGEIQSKTDDKTVSKNNNKKDEIQINNSLIGKKSLKEVMAKKLVKKGKKKETNKFTLPRRLIKK